MNISLRLRVKQLAGLFLAIPEVLSKLWRVRRRTETVIALGWSDRQDLPGEEPVPLGRDSNQGPLLSSRMFEKRAFQEEAR